MLSGIDLVMKTNLEIDLNLMFILKNIDFGIFFTEKYLLKSSSQYYHFKDESFAKDQQFSLC